MLTRESFSEEIIDFDEENKKRPSEKHLQPYTKQATVHLGLECSMLFSKYEQWVQKLDIQKHTIEICRRQVWMNVYGELIDKLREIEREVINQNNFTQSTNVDPIQQKIREMREMLECPKEKT